MSDIGQVIQSRLLVSETILWVGQPRRGLFLRTADWILIPISLMWGAFVFYWEYSVVDSGGPLFFSLWGIPFVLVGLYFIIGRFFVEAFRRSKTYYALTNKRIIIVSGMFQGETRSLDLKHISEFAITELRGSDGTIIFGGNVFPYWLLNGLYLFPGGNTQMAPRLELIPDANTVFEKIRNAQAEL